MGAGDDICTDPEQGRGGVREASSSAPTWAQPPCPHSHLAHPNQTPVPKASSQSSANGAGKQGGKTCRASHQ